MAGHTRRELPGEGALSITVITAADQATVAYCNTKAGSLSYITAGEIAREAMARATVAGLSALDLRTLLAVVARTVTYSKGADKTSSRDLAAFVYGVPHDAVTGWQRRNVTASLRALAAVDIIVYEPSSGPTARTFIGFPQRVSDDTPSYPQGDWDEHERGLGLARKVIGNAATPRNSPEEFSEERARAHFDNTAGTAVCDSAVSRKELADEENDDMHVSTASGTDSRPTPSQREALEEVRSTAAVETTVTLVFGHFAEMNSNVPEAELCTLSSKLEGRPDVASLLDGCVWPSDVYRKLADTPTPPKAPTPPPKCPTHGTTMFGGCMQCAAEQATSNPLVRRPGESWAEAARRSA